jgi:hypothetical protein
MTADTSTRDAKQKLGTRSNRSKPRIPTNAGIIQTSRFSVKTIAKAAHAKANIARAPREIRFGLLE